MKRALLALAATSSLLWTPGVLAQPIIARVTMEGTTITVQPDPIEVKRARGAIVIRWELPPGANYTFDPQGVVVNGQQFGGRLRPQNQIAHCGGGPRHITCANRNSGRGTFKYTVRLLDANRKLVEKDPLIVNIE